MPCGLRARKHRPVQPFVGQLQGTRCPSLEAMETGRDSDSGGLPHPTHTRAHLHQLRSFLHSVIHAFSHRASAERPGLRAPSVRRRGDSSVGVCEGHGNVHPAQLLEVNPGGDCGLAVVLGMKPALVMQTPTLPKLPLRGHPGLSAGPRHPRVVIRALPAHLRPSESPRPHAGKQLCLSLFPHALTLRPREDGTVSPTRPHPLLCRSPIPLLSIEMSLSYKVLHETPWPPAAAPHPASKQQDEAQISLRRHAPMVPPHLKCTPI